MVNGSLAKDGANLVNASNVAFEDGKRVLGGASSAENPDTIVAQTIGFGGLRWGAQRQATQNDGLPPREYNVWRTAVVSAENRKV
jgi:hypothetical protein